MSYQPLLDSDAKAESLEAALPRTQHDTEEYTARFPPQQQPRRRRETYLLALSLLLNLLLLNGCAVLYQQKEAVNPNLFWTPFNGRLRYHAEVFTSGFGRSVSAWQGNASAAKDAQWQDTYVEAFTVPKTDAARLANKTVPATSDREGAYVTSFSVFHYLHCLDMVRQVTEHIYFPDHYHLNSTHNMCHNRQTIKGFESHGMFSHEHIDHCIDSLRQAVSCQPDLGPVSWQWATRRDDPSQRQLSIFAETVHTCANFADILDYARERRFDDQVYGATELPALGQCGYEDENCGLRAQN